MSKYHFPLMDGVTYLPLYFSRRELGVALLVGEKKQELGYGLTFSIIYKGYFFQFWKHQKGKIDMIVNNGEKKYS